LEGEFRDPEGDFDGVDDAKAFILNQIKAKADPYSWREKRQIRNAHRLLCVQHLTFGKWHHDSADYIDFESARNFLLKQTGGGLPPPDDSEIRAAIRKFKRGFGAMMRAENRIGGDFNDMD
jgi:hypothetical protein